MFRLAKKGCLNTKMVELKIIKLVNFLKKVVWFFDYLIYLVINPFKFKKIQSNIKSILVVELKLLGDIIVTTPTIRALKKRYPQANIYVMVPHSMKEVLEENPNIKEIITYEKDFIKNNFNQIKEDLKKFNFDLAVILHPGSYLISKLLHKAKIPFRIGATKVGLFEGKGFFLNRKTKPTLILKHKIEDNLDVIKSIDIYAPSKKLELYTSKDADYNINKIFLKNRILNNDKIVVMHTKPNLKNHEWFQDRFAEVADYLIDRYNAKVIFTGSNKDKEYINSIINLIKNKNNAIDLSGNTIKDFFSIVQRADLVISVDTSAMHVAAAFDKPTIALFGAGNPKIWHPYCSKHIVLYKNEVCTSCMLSNCTLKGSRNMECMKSISPADVKRAINSIGVL